MFLITAVFSVTASAAPTTAAQAVVAQLDSLHAIDISPEWAPDVLAGRERIENMLKGYLALSQADKTSIAAGDVSGINAYLDGFCAATKTDKATYIKLHGSVGTALPSSSSSSEAASSSSSASSSAASSSSSQASSSKPSGADSSASSASSVSAVASSESDAESRGEQDASSESSASAEVSESIASRTPAITLEPSLDEASDADILAKKPKKPKSVLDRPVNDIVRIMVTTLVTVLLVFTALIAVHYIRKNRKLAKQRNNMLAAARVYSHVYRIKSVRKGKPIKKPEYAMAGGASAEESLTESDVETAEIGAAIFAAKQSSAKNSGITGIKQSAAFAPEGAEPKSFSERKPLAEPKAFTERGAPPPPPPPQGEQTEAAGSKRTVQKPSKDFPAHKQGSGKKKGKKKK